MSVERDEENLKVSGKDASRESGAMAGTFRSLINNMVLGVSEGFQKKLELQGATPFKASQHRKFDRWLLTSYRL